MTPDQVLKEMEAEEEIKAGPEMSPTAVSAGVIGVVVPPKDSSPVDQNTGLIKKKMPKVQE